MHLIIPSTARADGSFWITVEPDRNNRWSKLVRMGHHVECLRYTKCVQSAVDRVRIDGIEYSALEAGSRFKKEIEFVPPPVFPKGGEIVVL